MKYLIQAVWENNKITDFIVWHVENAYRWNFVRAFSSLEIAVKAFPNSSIMY